jgi:hypothetical protein
MTQTTTALAALQRELKETEAHAGKLRQAIGALGGGRIAHSQKGSACWKIGASQEEAIVVPSSARHYRGTWAINSAYLNQRVCPAHCSHGARGRAAAMGNLRVFRTRGWTAQSPAGHCLASNGGL